MFGLWYIALGAKEYRQGGCRQPTSPAAPVAVSTKPDVIPKPSEPIPIGKPQAKTPEPPKSPVKPPSPQRTVPKTPEPVVKPPSPPRVAPPKTPESPVKPPSPPRVAPKTPESPVKPPSPPRVAPPKTPESPVTPPRGVPKTPDSPVKPPSSPSLTPKTPDFSSPLTPSPVKPARGPTTREEELLGPRKTEANGQRGPINPRDLSYGPGSPISNPDSLASSEEEDDE